MYSHPERMADRILRNGRCGFFVERAQEQYDEEEARKLQKENCKKSIWF